MRLALCLLGLALAGGAAQDDLDQRIRAFEEADAGAREACLRALEQAGGPAALRALESFASLEARARRARAEIVAELAPIEALEPVLGLLGDADEDVRRSLARYLGSPRLGSLRASERLAALERLAREDPSSSVREQALATAGSSSLPGAAEVLDRVLDQGPGEEATAAARALVDLPAGRERLAVRVRRAFEGGSALGAEALAVLLEGYGRALADLAAGGRTFPERAPFVAGRIHPDPRVGAAARVALLRFAARLAERGEFERADAAFRALAGEGIPETECLDQRVRLAFGAGDAGAALERARELGRAAERAAPDEVLAWRFLALHFEGAALFAQGDAAGARECFRPAGECLAALVAERPDRLDRAARVLDESDPRWRAGGALEAQRIQLLALEELWQALCLLAAGGDPSPEALELLRSAHEHTIRSRIAAVASDVRADFPLDDLLRGDLSPMNLVLLNRRLAGRDEERSYGLLLGLGSALSAVAPWEMPGFEPRAAPEERLADPLADPARLGALERLREEIFRSLGRQILDNQRAAALDLDVSLPVNGRLKAQQDALEAGMREEASRLRERAVGDVPAPERREIFRDLANFLTPSTRYALDLVENLMVDGRLERAEALARRLIADLAERRPGVSDLESEHFLAGAERELGSVLSQANRPQEAEQAYESAVRRLEALENSLSSNPAGLEFLRRERADVLVSLAVNTNVRLGDPARALEFFERAYALDQRDFMQVLLACYRARSGRAAEARAVLERVAPSPSLFYNLACTHALLGDRDLALDFLARDLAENQVTRGSADARRSWMRADPDLASLRDDARFQRLLAEAP